MASAEADLAQLLDEQLGHAETLLLTDAQCSQKRRTGDRTIGCHPNKPGCGLDTQNTLRLERCAQGVVDRAHSRRAERTTGVGHLFVADHIGVVAQHHAD